MNLRALRELLKNRVHVRISQRPHVGRLQPERCQRVRHDWSVPAELGPLVYDLDIGAAACGGGDSFREAVDRRQAAVLPGVFTLVDGMDDFIHKSVQTDKCRKAVCPGYEGCELPGALRPKI